MFMKAKNKENREFDAVKLTRYIVSATLALLAIKFAWPGAIAVFGAEKKLPIYSVETEQRVLAITFDAAWENKDTDELLEILSKYGIKATFFICGYWMEKFQEDVRKLQDAGHDIANHGHTHAHVASLNYEQNKREIADAHNVASQMFGIEMDLYRPPYGEYNNTVISAAEDMGYFVIQWDVDSLDWMRPGIEQIIENVVSHKNLQNGSILLFHNDLPDTPEALREILRILSERGYGFIPVSELIHRENFRLDHQGRQFPK